MIDLVVTDLDGTLWNRDCIIAPETLTALVELERRHIPVLAATARNFYTTSHHLADNGVALDAVLLNGTLGRYKNGTTFYSRPFSPETVRAVLACFRALNLSPQINVNHPTKTLLVETGWSSCAEYQEYSKPFVQLEDLDVAVENMAMLGMGVIGVPREIAEEVTELLGAVDAICYCIPERTFASDLYSVMLVPGDAGKWSGIEAYCRSLNIDVNNVLAVGDGDNDIEMLSAAATACAMSHASDDVQAVADHVLTNWADLLDLL